MSRKLVTELEDAEWKITVYGFLLLWTWALIALYILYILYILYFR
ncbi:hypothetical protein Q0T50_01200 [Escherichia coli O183:H18]